MNRENYLAALEIISKHHSEEIVINQVIGNQVGDLGLRYWTIHLRRCVPEVINALIMAGYTLSMDEHGLSVSDVLMR